MNSMSFKMLAVAATLSFGPAVMAQTAQPPVTGGVSGVSGISGGLGIDFAAGQTPGSNTEKAGGFADAVDAAFGDTPKASADCGKLKCD